MQIYLNITDYESISFLKKAKDVFFQAYIGAQVIIIGFCLVNRYLKNLLQTKNIFARRDSFENVTEVWQKDYAKEAKDAKVEN